jgi:omega-6 fatty acid desaturase (delta-12 desaturase)
MRQAVRDLTMERTVAGMELSGLQGKALEPGRVIPTLRQIRQVVPKHCFKKDTRRSMKHVFLDLAMTLGCGLAAFALIPFKLSALPLWVAYAVVNGTVATGLWVLAHECGHGAFSDNKRLQDAVGFLIHTSLLVPYFSWQRSHAVHHRYTNHMTLGESHVPDTDISPRGRLSNFLRDACVKVGGQRVGGWLWGASQAIAHLGVGWPAYILLGETGGHARGVTNHFVHFRLDGQPDTDPLFPGRWRAKVYQSSAGVIAMLGLLYGAGRIWGFERVLALYVGPLMVTNAWLVLYTWLQHTDTDVPHFEDDQHNFMKGAFMTIDRPYDKMLGGVCDWLHHKIGTTHVAHHIDCTIPWYHAEEATEAIRKNFPEAYLYDDTPIPKALQRVASNCTTVKKHGDMWVWA